MSYTKKHVEQACKSCQRINNAGHPPELEAIHLIERGTIRDITELMENDDIKVIQ